MGKERSGGVAAIEKALGLFIDLIGTGASLTDIAARAGVPVSTAQRMVQAFVRQGLLSRTGRGRYGIGLTLAEAAGTMLDRRAVLAEVGREQCRQLAARIGTTVHLGVLEGDMVTYVVKAPGGGALVRTLEANQLEAYCTGIGKVLLASLDEAAREAYLAGGPFVQLTPATVIAPAALRTMLAEVAACGHATDRAEFEEGLYCLAVPVLGPGFRVVAALSASSQEDRCDDAERVRALRACARSIGARLGASRLSVWYDGPDEGAVTAGRGLAATRGVRRWVG